MSQTLTTVSAIAPARMRTEDAALYCGVSASFLVSMRLSGEGPRCIRQGRMIFYKVEDLNAWMAEHEVVVG